MVLLSLLQFVSGLIFLATLTRQQLQPRLLNPRQRGSNPETFFDGSPGRTWPVLTVGVCEGNIALRFSAKNTFLAGGRSSQIVLASVTAIMAFELRNLAENRKYFLEMLYFWVL
jgi:hypothetical protein